MKWYGIADMVENGEKSAAKFNFIFSLI